MSQREGGSISRFLQATFNSYAQSFNSLYNHTGTIFESRPKGKLIDSELYAVQVVRYIHLNPVAAGLVKSPVDWVFSDYNVWCGLQSPVISDLTLRESYFGSAYQYRRFVAEVEGPDGVSELRSLLIEDAE
jgi:putative transposase